jgi:TPR repeat protein
MMEYLDGEPLSALIHRAGKISAGEAVEILSQVLVGLGAAHAKGIVHRDVKPANLFLVREASPHVKVLDFGVAKLTGMDARASTSTGAVIGTVAYMAPEQSQPGREVDARADLYSTGVVLYELVAGRLPFDSDDWLQVLAMHRDTPPPPIGVEGVPAALKAVIARALAKDPSARFASAAEMRAALHASIAASPPPRKRAVVPWIALTLAAVGALVIVAVIVGSSRGQRRAASEVPDATASHTCDDGDPAACLADGRRALAGDGVPKDEARAVKLLEKACDGHLATGCTALALAVRDGHGLEADPVSAATLFDEACRHDDARACLELGLAYQNGSGVVSDDAHAAQLFEKACTGGSAHACTVLGRVIADGRGVPMDPARSRSLYQKGCDGDDPGGCSELGLVYSEGTGVTADAAHAGELFAKSCRLHQPYGCASLGFQLVYGQGMTADVQRGMDLMARACEDNSFSDACANLAVVYYRGDKVPIDLARAAELHGKACELEESISCFDLAEQTRKGLGVRPDPARATELYARACALGLVKACEAKK